MAVRKVKLATGCFYHVYNKSIAGFEIFRYREEYLRMLEVIRFYRDSRKGYGFSESHKWALGAKNPGLHGEAKVRVIAYCLMPTHVHFLMAQTAECGIEDYMQCVLGSYSVYLNRKAKRKGPLWEGRFGARLITTDEDLLHMTRYVHLNPTSAGLVKRPEEWEFSSYHEYLGTAKGEPLCDFKKLVRMLAAEYRKFCENRADYQQSLQILKSYLMD